MSRDIKFSIIIPVFNLEKYINICLKSILNQTYENYEVILIDDGSTDKTSFVINQLKEEFYGKLKVLKQKNMGASCARNRGILEASGDYVVFIDGDDYIKNDYLETFYQTISNYKEKPDVIASSFYGVDESGKVLYLTKVVEDKQIDKYGKPGVFVAWSKVYKKTFLVKNLIYFPEGKSYEDVLFSLLSKYKANTILSIPYAGYSYVQRKGSTMHYSINVDKFPFEELENAIKEIKKYLENNNQVFKMFEFDILYFFAGFIFLYCRNSSSETIEVMSKYALKIIGDYFPNYIKNPFVGIRKVKTLTLVQRISVLFFVKLCRSNKLVEFSKRFIKSSKE